MISFIICANSKWGDFAIPYINSVLRYEQDVEIILVDNGSPTPYKEGTGYFLIRLEPEPDYNYTHALNIGAEHAAGDFLMFCNDDILCTGKFSDAVHQLSPNFLYGNEIRKKNAGWGLEFQYIYGWQMLISRKVWNAVGLHDTYYKHAGFDDIDYSWRSQRAGYPLQRLELPFVHLSNLPGAEHRRHKVPRYAQNMSRSKAHFLEKVKNGAT